MAAADTALNVLIHSLVLANCLFWQGVAADAGWSYDPRRGGPDAWGSKNPDCAGLLQSPINITTRDAVYHHKLQYINIDDYALTDGVTMTLENHDGHTAKVHLSGKQLYIKEGSLPDVYKLEEFHFHWGAENGRGSEHAINGNFFPMELHLVHYQYHLGNISAALTHPFGLAVFAFLFKVVPKDNIKLNPILKYFSNITNPNDEVKIDTFPLRKILPGSANLDFYRYDGSLTTPPCSESVIWSVAVDNIEISEKQINMFRNLSDDNHAKLVDDFRPIQPTNSRLMTTTLRGVEESWCKCHGMSSVVARQTYFGFMLQLIVMNYFQMCS